MTEGPNPVVYAIGLPVWVTVHPDGRVEIDVDLSEVLDLDDQAIDMIEEQAGPGTLEEVAGIVEQAQRAGTWTWTTPTPRAYPGPDDLTEG